MRLTTWFLQMGRLLVAMTLVVGPSSPAFAGFEMTPASSNKDAAAIQPTGAVAAQAAQARVDPVSLKVPMYFEANKGQTDASVKFFTRAAGYNLYLTASEAVTVLRRSVADKTKAPLVLRMKLKGANASPSVKGQGILPGRTSYFIGNDSSKWQTGVKQYSRVNFSQVYPGIDMVYRFDKGNVVYDFVVAPGANPGRILVGFEGAKGLRLDTKGNLVINTGGGEMTYRAPQLYQTLGSKRVSVKGRFVLAANKNVRFEVGNYIKTKELVIDPTLSYSSFLGGAEEDYGYAIAVDNEGNVYTTGATTSNAFPTAGTQNLPLKTGAGVKGGLDVFVSKVNPNGTALLWSVYFGGSGVGDDVGRGIAVNSTSGKVYVTGDTTDSGTFPFTASFGTGIGTGFDAFVFAINGANTSPTRIYANRFGGAADDTGKGIAVDSLDAVYVTGVTNSIAKSGAVSISFPTTAGSAQRVAVDGAQTDAFIVKFNADGSQAYGTYLGGTGIDSGNAIAIDGDRNAYVTGNCGDAFLDAVVWANAFKKTISGASDAFIVKLDPAGASFLYETYVGGSGVNVALGIAVDAATPANVYITGHTKSADFPGPGNDADGVPYANTRVGAAQTTIMGGDPGAFIFKLRTAQTKAADGVYSTYFGRGGITQGMAIAVDTAGQAYVTGFDTGGTIPTVGVGALAKQAGQDAFVVQVNSSGSTFDFMSYLGGTTLDYGQGIALDSVRNIYVAGYTSSDAATFPILPLGVGGTFQQARGGGTYDAFVSRFGSASFPAAICTITSITPSSGFTVGGDTVTIVGTDLYGFTNSSVTFDTVGVSSFTMYASSTSLTAVVPRHPLVGALVDGLVSFRLTNSTGSCSVNYTYNAVVPSCTISGISPLSGDSAGGTSVAVTGTNFFGLALASDVKFGADNAASYAVNVGSTVVTAVSPRHPLVGALTAGAELITLVTSSGTCTVSYSYVLAPAPACGADFFYPSPATGAVGTFAYCMSLPGIATIKIYNVLGDLVAKLEDSKAAGDQTSVLNTARLAPGVYLYRLEKDYGGSNSTTSKVKKFTVRH